MGELFTGPEKRIRRTTLLAAASAAFVSGIWLAQYVAPDTSVLAGTVIVLFIGTLVHRYSRGVFLIIIVFVLLVFGLWRGALFAHQNGAYGSLYDQKVTFRARALQDAVYANGGQISFDAGSITFEQPVKQTVAGRVKVSGFGTPMVYRGDVLHVEGRLRRTLGGKQGQVSFAQLVVVERSKDPTSTARRLFSAGMLNALPDPEASFGLGILIGQRSTLPEAVADQLSMVGLTHIVAVSGYNLTIIVHAMQRLMAKRSKYQMVLVAGTLIGLFLLVTGFSASIVRAAVVSGLSLGAWYFGRRVKPLVLIGFAAAVTGGWNPYYVWGDIGWYLSFLAFFGVLVIAPLVQQRLYGSKQPRLLQQMLIETVSAQLMTIPLIMFVFQQLSLVALLSNVLVVPLVPLAMLLALLAGLAGTIAAGIAGWFAWPAQIVLTYMLDIAALLSRVPHAVAHVGLGVSGMLSMYGAIGFVTGVLWRTNHRKHAIITDIQLRQ